jgi:hypothetical protein
MKYDEILSSVSQSAFGLSLGALWQHVGIALESSSGSCLSQKEVFFAILRALLSEGAVSLARNGILLEGSLEEQVSSFLRLWPIDPSPDDLDGIGLWFLTVAPGGLVWHAADGVDLWT